ncbi:MAG: hypothetical protein K2Z81_13230 [Cyanobacteria bacterium]|nr:hypothetical protein [Cyanobacteriota bacterium]
MQFFYIQMSGYGGKDFCINYASLSLFNPRDYLILHPGDRLRESGGELWVPSLSLEEADASMELCSQLAKEQAIPFFEATKTVEGLFNCLMQESWGSNHHLNAEIAFCLARLGRFEESIEHFRLAIDLYRQDNRSWCYTCVVLCEQVIESIRSKQIDETLKRFTDHSISRLRLSKHCSQTARGLEMS